MKLPVNISFINVPLGLLNHIRDIAMQLNNVTEGRQSAMHASVTAAPTTGTWGKGDFLLNSAPSEAGSIGSKYIVHGWRCTAGGTPGTWVDVRTLTGN